MIRTANPVLGEKIFHQSAVPTGSEVMTIDGTVNKSLISIALTFAAALWAWSDPITMSKLYIPLIIGALVVAIAISFKPNWAPVLTPVYAVAEGFALGALSWMVALSMSEDPARVLAGQVPPNAAIVFQAIGLTFGTLFAMLVAYRSGLISVTEKFRMGVVAATGGILVLYLVSFVLSFFGVAVPFLSGNGLFSIGLSLVIVGVAALNLVLDFDRIERLAETRSAPKYMEWYGAFGLLVTLVWLYIEILRLLSKIQSRD